MADKTKLEEALKLIEKTYGKGSTTTFTEKSINTYDVIPTGSLQIDYNCLGIGGFARKKLYQLRGWQGSNKSTLCAHLASECQKQGLKVVYVDAEIALDKQYFEQLNVKMDDSFILVQPSYGEEGFDIALKLMETGEVGLVIFDSDSALLPKSMMEGEVGSQQIGKKAKMNSETYPKIKVAAGKHNVAVVAICQYRVNPGQMFGDNRTVPGGFAIDYWCDCIMELTKKLKKDGEETSGTITTVKTSKNKMFTPYRNVEVQTIFGYGIDKTHEILEIAKELEILKVWGKSITYKGEKTEVGEDKVGWLNDNPELLAEIKEEVMNKLNPVTELINE